MRAKSGRAERPEAAGTVNLWRHRDFVIMWTGQSASLIGSQMTSLALPLIAIKVLGASTFAVSLLSALNTLPWLLFSLPAGVLVDRHRKRSVMRWCDLLRAALYGSIPIAAAFSALTLPQLYVVAFVAGIGSVVFSSAYLSFPATLLERKELIAANSMTSSASALAQVAGPSLGGVLVGIVGAAGTITVDALSFLFSYVSLSLITHREPRPAQKPPGESGFRREALAGLRIVVGNRTLSAITFSNSLGNFLLTGITAVWTLYAVRDLGWSAQTVGWVAGASAVGGVLGSFLARRIIERYGLAVTLLCAQFPFVPGELVGGLAPRGVVGQVIVTIGFGIALSSVIVYNVAQRSYRLMSCDKAVLGRLNATISWLQWGLRPIAAVISGTLGTYLGLQPTIILFAALLPLCPLALWLSPLRGSLRSSAAGAEETAHAAVATE